MGGELVVVYFLSGSGISPDKRGDLSGEGQFTMSVHLKSSMIGEVAFADRNLIR
jgi:hypothetical protein